MGISTDALLAFGIDLGEHLPENWRAMGDEFEFEDLIAARMGVQQPTHRNFQDREWSVYWSRKREAVAAYPVHLEMHCSADYPMYVLAVQGSVRRARRGDPVGVNLEELAVNPDHVKVFRAFCEEFGIEGKEPGWLLFSYWH